MHPITTGTIEGFFQIVDLHLVYTRLSEYMKKCVVYCVVAMSSTSSSSWAPSK